MNSEQSSEYARKAINVLFVANPKGTSIGVLMGVVLDGLIGFLSPLLRTIEALNIAAIKVWHLISLGVVSMNLPLYLRRNNIDPSIKKAIEFIEEQKKLGNIADWQAKQMYVNLHQKVLENVVLENSKQDQVNKIDSLVTQPEGDNESNK